MTKRAIDIYQEHLDIVGQALWDQDLVTTRKHLAVPYRIIMLDADVTLPDTDALDRTMMEHRESLRRLGATAFVRICSEAEFQAGGTQIVGRHTAYVMRGGTHAIPPFESRMTLAARPDCWVGIDVTANVANRQMNITTSADMAQFKTSNLKD